MIITKSLDELMTQSLKRLSMTEITEIGPGGIARLLLLITNENLAEFYEFFSINLAQAYISQATKGNIDLIGYMLNCTRMADETDDNYKYRICNQVLTLATSNETAIRLAALSVNDVKNVIMKPYTFGTGSFSIYVITDNPNTGQSVINEVQSKVDIVKAYGTRFAVFIPKTIPVEFKAKLIFTKDADDSTRRLLALKVKQIVKDYINSRMPGESIIIEQINGIVMGVSDQIYDYQITSFAIKGRPMLATNQDSKWNERFIESPKPSSIDVH